MKTLLHGLLAGVCSVLAVAGAAQTFNKTYFPGRPFFETSVAVSDIDKNAIYFSGVDDDPNSPTYGKCMLVHLDDNGNVLQSVAIAHISTENVIKISPTGNVLIAGISIHGNVRGIETFKFDANLNYIWNTFTEYNADPGFGRIDMEIYNEDVAGETEEHYIIATPGKVPSNCRPDNDIATFLTNLKENGILQWSQYYLDPNRCNYQPVPVIRDYVSAITQVASPSGTLFTVAGRGEVWTPYSVEHQFCFTVDATGNVVSPYATFQSIGADPELVDLLWDGTDYLMSFLEERTAAIQSPVPNVSGIGLIRFDASFTPKDGHYYWKDWENYGLSISMVPDGTGDYVISHLIYDYTSPPPTSNAMISTGLLRVDHTTLVPKIYKFYNFYTQLVTLQRAHVTRGDGANFLFTNYYGPGGTQANTGGRLIKTDPNLDACGAAEFPVFDYQYIPTVEFKPYERYGANKYKTYPPDITPVEVDFTDCADQDDPNAYRQSPQQQALVHLNQQQLPEHLRIYPTALRDDATGVSVDIPGTGSAQVSVSDILGRKLYATTAAGGSRLLIPNGVFAQGVNVVRVVADGRLTVVKVNVDR